MTGMQVLEAAERPGGVDAASIPNLKHFLDTKWLWLDDDRAKITPRGRGKLNRLLLEARERTQLRVSSPSPTDLFALRFL